MSTDFPRPAATAAAAMIAMALAAAMPGGGASAQEAGGEPAAGIGTEAAEGAGTEEGSAYFGETFQDWRFRCVRAPEGQRDPCQLYQLLEDQGGNPVAEITVIPLPEERSDAVAGVTIVTPLGSLLTAGLNVSIDGGEAAGYPFRLCNQAGCVVQFGLSANDLTAFKRGATANITVVPAQAPDQTIRLDASLSGFTAAYEALLERRSGN